MISSLIPYDRELLCEIRLQDAFFLTVDEDWVYWSDWTSHSVWRTGKHGGCELELVKSFKSSKPHGIVAIPVEKCNMSLCKTPCFEPPHQASSVPQTKRGRNLRGGDGVSWQTVITKTRIEAPERVAKISAVRIWIFLSLIIR